ncbi:hypothetical protein Rhe02_41810 [Rhizocola hellebori]|uniref:Bacterial repeat domain-containing protein n=1 Tax=Rhizocola hellebori TaxID=1392758 RepID=A0A8J3VG95_9ACTN|nr:hypothetical protein [Rhizocola hellebori]GIH06114.1 hypothetical protein Rhe02_41810 [Rhizocola hellebori]
MIKTGLVPFVAASMLALGFPVAGTAAPGAVAAAPALAAVAVSQGTVVGGTPVTGTVTLTSAAPAGGLAVPLTSDNTMAATVPSSVTVAAGAVSASFPVTTFVVPNPQSALIIGVAGGVTKYAIVTVTTGSQANRGSISLARGGTGGGRVTSQPPGVDCVFTATTTTGACNNVFFPAGTQVRLEARPAPGSSFQGWEFETSCRDAPKVTIAAGVAHICRPGFRQR